MTARSNKVPRQTATTRDLADSVNRIVDGRTENYAAVTLTAGATTTTISDPRLAEQSVLLLSPLTANAAAALATTYVSARDNGSAVLTHANNAQTDRSFAVAWIG